MSSILVQDMSTKVPRDIGWRHGNIPALSSDSAGSCLLILCYEPTQTNLIHTMSIKSIFAGIFRKKAKVAKMPEPMYANMVNMLGIVAENARDLAPIVVTCKLTYGADRQKYIKEVQRIGTGLIIQLSNLATSFACYSPHPINKIAPVIPADLMGWCRTTHSHIMMLLELCARDGREIVADETAAKCVSALHKLHDTLCELLSDR